jgi:hypothetical protein
MEKKKVKIEQILGEEEKYARRLIEGNADEMDIHLLNHYDSRRKTYNHMEDQKKYGHTRGFDENQV